MSILQWGWDLGSQGPDTHPSEVVFPGWENAWHCSVKARESWSKSSSPGSKPAGAAQAEMMAFVQLGRDLCQIHYNTAKCAELSRGHKCSHVGCLQNGQKHQ